MKYLNYIKNDMVNGTGIRNVLWLSGCSHGCVGCFNKDSWNPNKGNTVTEDFIDQIIEDLKPSHISGLSITGGDPLHKRNYQEVINLCRRIKQGLPEKSIWVWTGFQLEEIQNNLLRNPILDTIDVLVDGKFIQDLKSTSTPFRGSTNQRIIGKENF